MNSDIENYVEGCEICQKEKPQSRLKDIVPIISKNSGDIWKIDIVGPFKESEEGYRYLVTMVDYFSKKAGAVPIFTKDMHTIVHLVHTHII